ncbi:hypothetical protein DYBT9623_01521 [Dyadobacter sp. CECT 9623]|uniref:Uncharacterized protein n=1 Tax=Dyadobacter linearis TaxID=2823330 RepID=A0ABM8UMR8_9BACT|nr:hypothetical protein DYBT9623_01521 [Dyadobacter sp. CECT 9623]
MSYSPEDKNRTAMFLSVIKSTFQAASTDFSTMRGKPVPALTVATICRMLRGLSACRYMFCSLINIDETHVIIFGNNKVPITFAKLPYFFWDNIALL